MDDISFTVQRRTAVVALVSTDGTLAFQSCSLNGPGRLALRGLHYEQSRPIKLRNLGWPVDNDLALAGFIFRRFRSRMTSPTGAPYVIKWTTIGIPWWFVTAVSALCAALFARAAAGGRRSAGFAPIIKALRRWLSSSSPRALAGA